MKRKKEEKRIHILDELSEWVEASTHIVGSRLNPVHARRMAIAIGIPSMRRVAE